MKTSGHDTKSEIASEGGKKSKKGSKAAKDGDEEGSSKFTSKSKSTFQPERKHADEGKYADWEECDGAESDGK